MVTQRVALVTCSQGPGLDEDEPAVLAELSRRGIDGDVVAWDDDVDWRAFDLAVIRSTWDYHDRLDDFLVWAERVSALTRLENPVEAVRVNHDKRYLGTLAEAGVPTVPTRYVDPSDTPDLATLPDAPEYVVKPTVSAGSQNTFRGTADDIAAHVAVVHDHGKTAMIQPYVSSVDVRGETGLLFFGGRYSHAFTKSAMLPAADRPSTQSVDGLYLEERITTTGATAAELRAAERCLAALPALGLDADDLLYARIDLVTDADGTVRLMELELIEPSFFLWTDRSSVGRFADAVATTLNG